MPTIPDRSGLEVFVNDGGTITIRQDAALSSSGGPKDEPLVVVHPDDVSTPIRALEDARRKARRAGAEEREEITIPAIVNPRRRVRSP